MCNAQPYTELWRHDPVPTIRGASTLNLITQVTSYAAHEHHNHAHPSWKPIMPMPLALVLSVAVAWTPTWHGGVQTVRRHQVLPFALAHREAAWSVPMMPSRIQGQLTMVKASGGCGYKPCDCKACVRTSCNCDCCSDCKGCDCKGCDCNCGDCKGCGCKSGS